MAVSKRILCIRSWMARQQLDRHLVGNLVQAERIE